MDVNIGTITATAVQVGNGNTQNVGLGDGSTFDCEGGCGARTANLTGTCLCCQAHQAEALDDAKAIATAAAPPLPTPEPEALEVTIEEKILQDFGGAVPPSLSVKLDDAPDGSPVGKTFTVTVKREKDVIETFAGLTTDDFRQRLGESKHVIITNDLATKILDGVNTQRLLKAMAVRHAQIAEQFKAAVVDPIKAYAEASVAGIVRTVEEAATFEALRVSAEAAQDKLRVFGSVGDRNLGMRLALMNRAERRKYFGELKERRGKKARAKARGKARKARRSARA